MLMNPFSVVMQKFLQIFKFYIFKFLFNGNKKLKKKINKRKKVLG